MIKIAMRGKIPKSEVFCGGAVVLVVGLARGRSEGRRTWGSGEPSVKADQVLPLVELRI